MAKKRSYGVELVIRGKDLASGVISRVGRSLRGLAGVGRSIGGFIEKIPGLSILGVEIAMVGRELKDLAIGAAEAGSVFNDLGVQTGISTRALQEVAYAADQAGVPLEEFKTGLQRMTAVLGKGVGAKQLRMLGKDALGFAARLKKAGGPGEKFELILAQMAAIPDATKRAAFGMTFFGRSGVKLAALAGDGADGVRALREEAQKLGLVMDGEQIRRADEFGDTWAALGKVFESGKRDFGSGLIEGLLPDMKDLLGNVKDNRKEIGLMLRDLGKDVGHGLIDAAHAIRDAFEWSKGAVAWLSGNSGVVAIGAALALLAANPFFAAIAAAVAAVKWLLDNTPKPATQNEKDKGLLEGVARGGTIGGAGEVMLGEMQGNPGGWAAGLMNVGGFVANQDEWVADAKARTDATKMLENQVFNDVRKIEQLGLANTFGSGIDPMEMSVEINLNDPGGMVDGKPKVKGPDNVDTSTKVKGNTGRRTTNHLTGDAR